MTAFDRHRIGDHQLNFPEHETGRRCMDIDEMVDAGLEQDGRGRWRVVVTEADRARLSQFRVGRSA